MRHFPVDTARNRRWRPDRQPIGHPVCLSAAMPRLREKQRVIGMNCIGKLAVFRHHPRIKSKGFSLIGLCRWMGCHCLHRNNRNTTFGALSVIGNMRVSEQMIFNQQRSVSCHPNSVSGRFRAQFNGTAQNWICCLVHRLSL